jgi:hypothetical protein
MLQKRHYIRLIQDYHLSNSHRAILIFPTLQSDQHTVSVQDDQHQYAGRREPATNKFELINPSIRTQHIQNESVSRNATVVLGFD